MKVLSLFDGISCGMVALERAGIPVKKYYASEIDKNAIDISKRNYSEVIQIGDVTKHYSWDLGRIDLLIGGSPCQGFSRNGMCLNFDDSRSKLFFQYVEVLQKIKAQNPDVKFLLENVEMKNEWRDIISDYLGVQPVLINSKVLSSQSRPRLYWTNIDFNYPDGNGDDLESILDKYDNTEYYEKDGLFFDKSIDKESANLVSLCNGEVRVRQATKKGYIVANSGDGINLQFPKSKTRRGRVITKKSPTLDCGCDVCVIIGKKIRKFSVRELERLQTLPEGYTEGSGDKIAKKAIGNGWTVDVIAHIFKGLKE